MACKWPADHGRSESLMNNLSLSCLWVLAETASWLECRVGWSAWFIVFSVQSRSEPVGRDYNTWKWSRLEPHTQANCYHYWKGKKSWQNLSISSDVLKCQVGHLERSDTYSLKLVLGCSGIHHTSRHSPHSYQDVFHFSVVSYYYCQPLAVIALRLAAKK